MDLPEATRNRIISPITAGIEAMEARGIHKITLAGTRHTMRSDQLSDYFTEKEIEVEFPDEEDIQALDRIRLAVYSRGFTEELAAEMTETLSSYKHVLLACTELSILNREKQFSDMVRLQIQAALRLL